MRAAVAGAALARHAHLDYTSADSAVALLEWRLLLIDVACVALPTFYDFRFHGASDGTRHLRAPASVVTFERLFRALERGSVVWFLDADLDARVIVGRVAALAQAFIDARDAPAVWDVYPYKSEPMLAFTLLLNDLADDPWGLTPVPTPQLQRLLIVFTRELFVYACRFMYPSAAAFYRLFQRARMSQLKRLVGHVFRLSTHRVISLALSEAKAVLLSLATELRLPVSGFGVDFPVPLAMTQPLFRSSFPTWFGAEPSRPLPPLDLSDAEYLVSYRRLLSDNLELELTSPGRQIAFRG